MDADSFILEQRSLREAVRRRRRTPDGRSPVASEQVAGTPEAPTPDRVHAPAGRGRGVALASVIVVCWNAADVLGRCLDQLLAQDHGNYEIIVVDDGSEDNTLDVAEAKAALGEIAIVRRPPQSRLPSCAQPRPRSGPGGDHRVHRCRRLRRAGLAQPDRGRVRARTRRSAESPRRSSSRTIRSS